MWFVKKLREWEIDGNSRRYNNMGTTTTNNEIIVVKAPILAPQQSQQSFAMETVLTKNRQHTPVGVYHLMRTVSFHDREHILTICPEARRLFRIVLHDGRCSLECLTNFTTMNYFQYIRFKKEKDFNSCKHICRIDHPMMMEAKNWSMGDNKEYDIIE